MRFITTYCNKEYRGIMTTIKNKALLFKMILDGWELHLFSSRINHKKLMLKVEISEHQFTTMNGGTLILRVYGTCILRHKISTDSFYSEIYLPDKYKKNNFEVAIEWK